MNIGILDEISLQLYFLVGSERMLWCYYQRMGSSRRVQTSVSTGIAVRARIHVLGFPSGLNDRQNICQGGPSTPLVTQINGSSKVRLLLPLQKRYSITATVHPRITKESSRMTQQQWSVIKLIEIMRRLLLLSAEDAC